MEGGEGVARGERQPGDPATATMDRGADAIHEHGRVAAAGVTEEEDRVHRGEHVGRAGIGDGDAERVASRGRFGHGRRRRLGYRPGGRGGGRTGRDERGGDDAAVAHRREKLVWRSGARQFAGLVFAQ
jgi:hypothetical protein